MANPFGSKVKSSSAAKFKAITGKGSSGQTFAGGSRDSKAKAAASGREYNVGGTVSAPSFARGGRSKGKGKGGKGHKTHINIAVVAPNKGDDAATKLPPGLPPGGPPPGLPAGGPPMAPPPGMGPGLPPGGPPPGMPPMKRGGAAYAKGGKVGMKSGAESGPGRLEKAKAYGGNARKG